MELKNLDFNDFHLEKIKSLVSEHYTLKAIAIKLDVNISLFRMLCADESHPVGRAYSEALLLIEQEKNTLLVDQMYGEKPNDFAIATHDKRLKDQAFIDARNDIFSSDTEDYE
ncbi:hypothetical protein LNJ03_11290 [Tenacibaculum dicentrarchi]|nr:hypothetical protein [Tenacibaculum dicentrarchi]